MSKAYAKMRAEEKKKNSSASSQKKDKFQQAYEQGTEIYNQNRQNTIQEVRRLQQSLDATSGIAGKTETTARTYLDNLAAYRARLASLGMYGANVGRAYSQAGKNAAEVRSWLPALQQQDRERARQREIQAARNRRPWAERVGLVDPNEAEMTFGVYNPSASERGRLSNVAAAGGRGWLAGQANAFGFALDPDQPDEAEMFFGKAPTSKLGEKISEKINQGLFNESQRLYGAADQLNAQAQENEAAAREGLGKVGNVLVDAGIAGTQMLLDAGLGRATGTGMASMGTRTFGQSAREALDSGASYQQAMDYGALSAAVEVGTEKMFDVGKVFGKGAGDELIEAWIAKHGKTAAGTTILRMLAGMGSEGLEEVVSSAVNPILRSGFDPDALKDYRTREYWADMLNEGLVGALLGGVGVAGNVITGGNARMKAEVEQRALNQRLERADAFNKAQREFFAGNTMQTGTADAEAQRVLNRNSGTVGESDKAAVRTAARQQYGAQARAVESVYESGTADAETFLRQFETAYNLGREGANIETAMNTPATAGLNEQQRRNAWLIGRDVGVRAGQITEDTSGTPGSSSPTEIGGAQNNGEAIRVRGSGERDAGASALGSVQQVESGTGSYQEGRSLGVGRNAEDSAAADLRYSEEVKSARDLGIENGAVIKNLRTVDESSYTPEMKQYAQEMAQTGHKVTYVSGLIHAQDGPGGMITRARGMVNGNGDVIIQVDNERFTAIQIGRHEDGHLRIARGEIDLAATKEAVRESMGQEQFDRAMQDYAEAYAGLDMTEDEIWEEIVCDAQGEMNIFEGTLMQNAEQRASDLIRETKAQTTVGETTQQRAPPEGEQKMSTELGEYDVYNSRAVISEETLDLWLSGSYFGSTNPNYAQAYITYMSPDSFLNLTTRDRGERALIYDSASESKTVEGAVQQSRRQPIQLMIDHETGEIKGHEGRHRMVALMRAGVRDVPVLLFDSSNKYSKAPIDELELKAQFNRYVTEDVRDLQPFSQGNRETLIEKYVKPTSRERIGEKYGGRKTVKFSMEAPIEETRTLVALHNLDEDNLRRTLKLGAFPSPSIAIVKAEQGHSKYGSITAVFPRSTIDPTADRRNRVYGGDAWTPTHRNARVEYPVDVDKAVEFEEHIGELSGMIAGGAFSSSSVLRAHGVDNETDMTAQEVADRLVRDDAVRAAYLAATGTAFEPEYSEKQFDRRFGNETVSKAAERIGEDRIDEIVDALNSGDNIESAVGSDMQTIRQIFLEFYADLNRSFTEKMGRKRGMTTEEVEDRIRKRAEKSLDDVSVFTYEDFVRNVYEYIHSEEKTGTEIDRLATLDKMKAAAPDADVKQWLLGEMEGLLGEPGIYNGKDYYTSSGNRRSFKQLHWEYTAENIVRAMNNASARGENYFGFGASGLHAVATTNFQNVQQMHDEENRLRAEDAETYQKKFEELDKTIQNCVAAVRRETKAHSSNSFEEQEIIGSVMMMAAQGARTVKGVQSVFRSEGYIISDSTAKQMLSAFQEAAEIPTEYFEAKPQRVVGFDETAALIVPDNIDAVLKRDAESAGMNVLTYKAGDEADRLRVVNSVEGAKFSRELETDYEQALKNKDDEWARALVRKAAEEWGAVTDERGRAIPLFHGTHNFGFTEFHMNRGTRSDGLIYASTKQEVAANYAGPNHYAGVRQIGKGFAYATKSVNKIIDNASAFTGRRYKKATKQQLDNFRAKTERAAQKLNDRYNDLYEMFRDMAKWESDEMEFSNAIDRIGVILSLTADKDGWDDQTYVDETRYERGRVVMDVKNVQQYMQNHREEIIKSGWKDAMDLFSGYKLFDTIVDIVHGYTNILEGRPQITTSDKAELDSFSLRDAYSLQEGLDEQWDIGSYELYGKVGDKPYILDAEGENWTGLKAPDIMGDDLYHDTDEIAKKAKELGYTAAIIKNVYDGGVKADDYIFFSENQVKSADPVTYDEKGKPISLDERFSDKKDLRYSRETDLDQLARENRALQKETDELRKAVQKWKRETKRTERYSAREEDVRRSAKDLIKTLNSTADAAEITADMKALAEYIMNGENGEAASWLTVREMADRIADKVVGAEQVNIRGDVFNEYQRLTEILKGKTLHIDPEAVPDLQGYENLLEFNRANMGTMRLSAKEMKPGDKSVQDAYYEMIEAMPGWFPEDASTDAEMVANMLEVLDGLRPVYGMSDETSYHYDEAVTWAANDIIDRVLDESIRQMPKTFADRAQAKLDKERARLYQRIREVRAQGNERVERTKREYAARSKSATDRMRQRQEKQIADLKAKQKAKEKNARERREENAGIRKYRVRVERTVKTLTDWLQTNSDKEHIPEGIKKPLAEFLSTIDFTSKQALRGGEQTAKDRKYLSRMEALQEILTRQLNYQDGLSRNAEDVLGGYLDITPEYMEQMQAHIDAVKAILGGEADVETGVINRMSAAELQDLDHLLTTLKRAIQGINKLTENARYQSVIEAAKSTMDELGKIREDGGETGKLRSFFMWDNTTPFYAFKRFGAAASSLFEALQNGWDKFAFNVKEIMEFTREAYTTKQVREWSGKTQEFTLENGEKVTMTPAQVMTLYEVLKQEDAVRHAQGGGVRIGNIERSGKKTIQQTAHHHFSERDLQQIFGSLTDEQKQVADKLQKYMQDRGSEWGNEVSMKRYGYKAFGVDHYFPIQTEDRVRDIKTPGEEGNDLYRLLNISATKGRMSNANNALVVRDIFDVFADHMTDMAKYNSLALPILDATKWINYRERTDAAEGGFETQTVQRSIERAFGENALRYYTTFMKDLNGKRESTGRGEDLPRKMISNYKVAAVGANLRVVLLQPTAYVRAIYALNGRQLAIAPFIPGALKEMDKYSGIAAWKSLGYYDTNIARGVREQIKDGGGFKEKLQEASMKGAELGDRLTWGALWNACKLDVKARNKGIDGEALMQKTAEKFREVVYSTQVVDSTMTRSHNMRATSLFGSMATAFMAEPTLSYNLVLDAYSDYSKTARSANRSEAWKKTRGKIAKAFTVYTVSALASAIVESIADAFRDDDEYETFMDKFMEALLGEPGFKGRLNSNLVNDLLIFNKLPIIKDAISILSGYGADRLDVEWISNALKAYSAIAEKIQLANGDLEKPTKTTYFGKMTWYGAVFLGLKTLSQATGLPVSGLTREAVTIWNSTAGEITGDKVKTYDASAKSQIQKGLENGYLSEDRAAELLVREGEAKDADKAYWMVQEMLTGSKKYDAIVDAATSGDKKAFDAALQELKKHGVSEKDAISNVKSAVGKMYRGSEDEEPSIDRSKAIRMLTDYAGMKQEDAEKAVDKWTLKRETGYDLSDMRSAYVDGDVSGTELQNALVKYGGKTDEEAQKAVRELEVQKEFGIEYGVQNVQEAVAAGELSEADARTIWTEYGGKSEEDADELIAAANFKAAHSDVDLDDVSASRINIYEQYAPEGTDAAQFMSYAAQIRKDQNAGKYPGIPDGKGGKKAYSVMDAVAEWINSLPISAGEKTALLLTYTNGKTTSLSRYNWS